MVDGSPPLLHSSDRAPPIDLACSTLGAEWSIYPSESSIRTIKPWSLPCGKDLPLFQTLCLTIVFPSSFVVNSTSLLLLLTIMVSLTVLLIRCHQSFAIFRKLLTKAFSNIDTIKILWIIPFESSLVLRSTTHCLCHLQRGNCRLLVDTVTCYL